MNVRAEIERHGVLEEFPELRQSLEALAPDKLGRYLFPFGDDHRRETATLFVASCFLFDDVAENMKSETGWRDFASALAGHAGMRSQEQRASSFYRLFVELGRRIITDAEHVDSAWRHRYRTSATAWLASIDTEHALLRSLRETGLHPAPEPYLRWRRDNVAGRGLCALVEWEAGTIADRPGDVAASVFEERCTTILALQNDLASFSSGRDQGRLNIVLATAEATRAPAQDAATAVAATCLRAERELAADDCLASASRTWAAALAAMVAGWRRHLDEASRYICDSAESATQG